jgi:hypothetical protein
VVEVISGGAAEGATVSLPKISCNAENLLYVGIDFLFLINLLFDKGKKGNS